MTIGDLNGYCQGAVNVTTEKYWISHIVRDAIVQLDIKAIQTLAQRLDGGVPDKGERNKYANYIGSFLEDVMLMPIEQVRTLNYEDPVYLAMAKAIYHISLQVPTDSQSQRDKNIATEMIFERCGGKVTEPVREFTEFNYVEPDWMKQGLPKGEDPTASDNP